jgi:hypothetical protein
MVKLNEFVAHVPGHKNSAGKSAPWVVKSHKTGKIISSHASKADAEEHLTQMHYYGSKKENKIKELVGSTEFNPDFVKDLDPEITFDNLDELLIPGKTNVHLLKNILVHLPEDDPLGIDYQVDFHVNIDQDPDIAILEILFYAISRRSGNPYTEVLPDYVTNSKDESIKKLRTKRMFQIFSYTFNEAHNIVDKYSKIRMVSFSAKSSEGYRSSIYQRFAKSFGGEVKTRLEGGFVEFEIYINEPEKEDIKSFLEFYLKEDGEGGIGGGAMNTSTGGVGSAEANAPENALKIVTLNRKNKNETEL